MDPTPAMPIRFQREHILVVDDEDHIRFGLSLTLRKVGYQVMLASNGINALEGLRQRQGGREAFALMILDLRMPLMGGVRLLSVLEAEGIHLPVIGITGCTEADAVAQLEAAGCAAVLTKPFTVEAILASVGKVLGERPHALADGDVRQVAP